MRPPPPRSTLFPYTTLFRSFSAMQRTNPSTNVFTIVGMSYDETGIQKMREWEQQYGGRSEEHTSELQSRGQLVCRLLLEKKKKKKVMQREQIERKAE